MEDNHPLRILFVEDVPADAELAARALRKEGLAFTSSRVETKDAFLEALEKFQPDLIISDYAMPEFDGMQALKLALARDAALPFILLTGSLNEETAVACMKAGATDYVLKDRLKQLPFAVKEALEQKKARLAKEEAERALRESEERFRSILDNIQDGYFEVDTAGNFTFFNPALVRMLGRPAHELMGMNNRRYMTPEGGKAVFRIFNRIFRTGIPEQALDWGLVRPDGTLRSVEVSVSLIKAADGSINGFRGTAHDITERKRAEEALRTSEAQYRLLAENMSDTVWLMDMNLRTIYISPSVIRTRGYTLDEINALPLDQQLTPGSLTRAMELFAEVLSPENLERPDLRTTYSVELEFYRKDGSKFWSENTFTLILDQNKQPINILGTGRDITERKRAEEALRKSEARLRAILDATPFPIALVDLQDNIIDFWSHSALTLFGHTAPTATEWYEIAYPDPDYRRKVIDRWKPSLEKAQLSAQPVNTGEYRVACRDGSVRICELYAAFLADRLIVTFNDITERKRAEEALRESEKRYRQLIEHAPAGIFEVDLIHNRFLSVNDVMCEYSGYTQDELLALSPPDILTEDSRQSFLQGLARIAVGEPVPPTVEYQIRGKNGREFWVLLNAQYFYRVGTPVRATVVIHDITERKRAEEALREAEERFRVIFEHANDAIHITNADDEILIVNSRMCALMGYSREELLKMRVADLQAPEVRQSGIVVKEELARHGNALFEGLNLHSSGRQIPVEISVACIARPQGDWYVSIVRDITERRRGEEQLRYQAALLESVNDAIVASDAQYRLTAWNAAAEALYGWKAEEVLGRNGLEIVRTEWPAVDAEEMRRTIAETGRWRGEATQQRKDGTRFPLEVSSLVVHDQASRAIGYVSVNRDITERKRAEQAMIRRLAELEALYGASTALRIASTVEQALPNLLDATLSALDTDVGAIWLYDPANRVLRAAVARGWFRQISQQPMKLDEGIGGSVFTSGQARYSAEFATDPATRSAARDQVPPGWGGACLPLRAAAETVGVLLAAVPSPRQITPEQMKLLTALTEIAGATLHRMRLHEETVRRLEHLQALRAVDQAIAASLDLRVTLDILLDQTLSQLGMDAAVVLLLDPYQHTLKFAAGRGFRTRAIEATNLRLGEDFAGRVALERRLVQVFDAEVVSKESLFAKLWSNEGFKSYQGVPLIAKGQVKGVLEVFHRTDFTPNAEWIEFLETLGGQAAITIDNAQLFEGLQRANMELGVAYDATIEGWSRAMDLRDRETEGHTQRVTEITLALARAMGMDERATIPIRRGALLHDIGKMGIPDSILLKPGKLTDEEWVIMRQHPQLARAMLMPITYLRQSLDIPYCHHEKWDGTGYPQGLQGEQIPLAARVFAIVDVWDALMSDRPYRKAWTKQQSLTYIREQSSKHFDPQVVEVFIQRLESGSI